MKNGTDLGAVAYGYIRMEKPQGCFLCDLPNEDDDESNLILYRGEWNFIMMNNIPIIRAPAGGAYRHIATWTNCRSGTTRAHGPHRQIGNGAESDFKRPVLMWG